MPEPPYDQKPVAPDGEELQGMGCLNNHLVARNPPKRNPEPVITAPSEGDKGSHLFQSEMSGLKKPSQKEKDTHEV